MKVVPRRALGIHYASVFTHHASSSSSSNDSGDISNQLPAKGISNTTDQSFSQTKTMMDLALVEHSSSKTKTVTLGIFQSESLN